MAAAGIIIEFTGLVGSGKSTLAKEANRSLQSAGITALSPAEAFHRCFERSTLGRALLKWLPAPWKGKAARRLSAFELRLVYPCLFMLAHPRLVLNVLHSAPALKALPGWHRRIILRLFFEVAGQFYYFRGHLLPGEAVVFDEGLVHRAINLYAWEPGRLDQQAIREYLRRIPASDLAVWVSAPVQLCLERASARGLPARLKDKDPEVVERFMRNSAGILALAAQTGERPVLQVDNSSDLDAAVSAIQGKMKALVRTDGAEAAAPNPPMLIPRPDRLYSRMRYQGHRLNGAGQEVRSILEGFGLALTGDASSPSGPGRSENWIVSTPEGKKFLKCYKKSISRENVLHEHSILTYLAGAGFQAPHLFPTPEGGTFIEREGKFYALFDYLDGYFQYHDYLFTPAQTGRFVTACGRVLGELHNTLRDFEPAGRNPNGFQSRQGPRWREMPWYLDQLREVRQAVGQMDQNGSGWLMREVSGQADWLERRVQMLDEKLRSAALPRLIIHGDYGPYNVFFKAGAPVMILDFELSRLDWRLTDLANALYFFAIGRSGFRPNHMDHFLRGYFSLSPVESGEMGFLPDAWQFLLLRRVIVCWRYAVDTPARQWQAEAQRKLALAHWIDGHREGLSIADGSGRVQVSTGR